MKKEELAGMTFDQKSRMAVAFLIKNSKERPEGTERLFSKLEKYEGSMMEMVAASEQARKTLSELELKQTQLYGSITSIVDLTAEDLPKEKVEEWCERYQPPEMPGQRRAPQASRPGGGPIKKAGKVDMAGSTSDGNPVKVPQVPQGKQPQEVAPTA
jgi:hypothetical protein